MARGPWPVGHQLSAISHQPSAVSHQPPAASRQTPAVSHQPISHQLQLNSEKQRARADAHAHELQRLLVTVAHILEEAPHRHDEVRRRSEDRNDWFIGQSVVGFSADVLWYGS